MISGDTVICSCCVSTEHPQGAIRVPDSPYKVYHCDRCGERCDHTLCKVLPPNSNGTYGVIVVRDDDRIPRRLV